MNFVPFPRTGAVVHEHAAALLAGPPHADSDDLRGARIERQLARKRRKFLVIPGPAFQVFLDFGHEAVPRLPRRFDVDG